MSTELKTMTKSMTESLSGLAARAKQLADKTATFAAGRRRLRNFEIIADETESLAERLTEGLGRAEHLKTAPPEVLAGIELAEVLDDMAMTMDIIKLNVLLQISRTLRPVRELDDIGAEYVVLAESAEKSAAAARAALSDVAQTLRTETRKDLLARLTDVRELTDAMRRRCEDTVGFISTGGSQAGDLQGNFMPYADEVAAICRQYRMASERLRIDALPSNRNDWLTLLESFQDAVSKLDDDVAWTAMLAFSARLDLVRSPEADYAMCTAGLIQQLAAAGRKTYDEAMCLIAEARDLAALLTDRSVGEGDVRKSDERRNTALKCSLLNFYAKTECAKVNHVLNGDTVVGLEPIKTALKRLNGVVANDEDDHGAEVAREMVKVSDSLMNFYNPTGKRFPPFEFLAGEYRDLSG